LGRARLRRTKSYGQAGGFSWKHCGLAGGSLLSAQFAILSTKTCSPQGRTTIPEAGWRVLVLSPSRTGPAGKSGGEAKTRRTSAEANASHHDGIDTRGDACICSCPLRVTMLENLLGTPRRRKSNILTGGEKNKHESGKEAAFSAKHEDSDDPRARECLSYRRGHIDQQRLHCCFWRLEPGVVTPQHSR